MAVPQRATVSGTPTKRRSSSGASATTSRVRSGRSERPSSRNASHFDSKPGDEPAPRQEVGAAGLRRGGWGGHRLVLVLGRLLGQFRAGQPGGPRLLLVLRSREAL